MVDGMMNMNDDADAIAEKEEAPIFPMSKQTLFFFREDRQVQAAVR